MFLYHAPGLIFCDKQFVLYYVFFDVVCRFHFRIFLLVEILFFVIGNFVINVFLLVIFMLVVIWFSLSDYLLTVFTNMSGFVTVMTCRYVCTLFMSAVLSIVPESPSSRVVTLVLGFYVEVIFIFSWIYWS